MITLRDYQERGVEGVRAAYRAGRRMPLLVMPTGAGKTICFSHISAAVRSASGRRGAYVKLRPVVTAHFSA